MKKYIVLFNLLILFGFVVGNKAVAQNDCVQNIPSDTCYMPWMRIAFDYPLDCNGDSIPDNSARVSVCFYCFVTRYEMCYYVREIENLPAGCSDYIDHLEIVRYIANVLHPKMCGTIPCDQELEPMVLHVIFPICADMYYDGVPGRYRLVANSDCDRKCVWNLRWCWCNCTPDCDPSPDCTPHVKYDIFNEVPVGLGVCQAQNVDYSELCTGPPRLIRSCQQFKTKCNKDEGFKFEGKPCP